MEKIFNVEFALPKYEERIICEELSDRINQIVNRVWTKSDNTTRVKNIIFERGGKDEDYTLFIPLVLRTMRDVIRFSNSFYMTVCVYSDAKIQYEIDYRDLFYIELLRYFSLEAYEMLRNTPLEILKIDGENLIVKQISDYEQIFDGRHAKIFELLFDNKTPFFNSICRIRSYNNYFMYRLDERRLTQMELLGLSNFNNDENVLINAEDLYKCKYAGEFEKQLMETFCNMLNDGVDCSTMCRIIKVLSSSKNKSLRLEVSNVCIFLLKDFRKVSVRQFKEIIDLFNCIDFNLESSKQYDIDEFLRTILVEAKLVEKVEYQIHDKVHRIIKDFLINTSWPHIVSDSIKFLLFENVEPDRFILTDKSLKHIQVRYFYNFYDKLSDTGYALFECCIDKKSNYGNNKLCEGALMEMRRYIRRYPEKYLNIFVNINGPTKSGLTEVFPERNWMAIFSTPMKFESFLAKNKNILGWNKVNNFWQLYKYNGYNSLRYENASNINDKVENGFREEMVQLSKLLNVKGQIHNKSKSLDLLEQVNSNTLEIKLKYILYNKLRQVINN